MTKTLHEMTIEELLAEKDRRAKKTIIDFIEPTNYGPSPLSTKLQLMLNEALSMAVVQHLGLEKNPWSEKEGQAYKARQDFHYARTGPLWKLVEAETKKLLEGMELPELSEEERAAITKSARVVFASCLGQFARSAAESEARREAEKLTSAVK